MAALIYAALSILVGLAAIGQRGGFLFYFLMSLALTPLAGIFLLVLLAPKPKHRPAD